MKYTNEEFKNLICIELGKHHLAKGNIWAFQKYNPFRARMYPRIQNSHGYIGQRGTFYNRGRFCYEALLLNGKWGKMAFGKQITACFA